MAVGRPLQMPFRNLTSSELAISIPPPRYCSAEPESTAAAARAPPPAVTMTGDWITLETWLERMASHREWPSSDVDALTKWKCVRMLLIGKYTALLSRKYCQDLIWNSWRSDHLLVRGYLDLNLPYEELDRATTMDVAMLGDWSPLPPVEEKDAVKKRGHRLRDLVQELILKYFPQYSVIRGHPHPAKRPPAEFLYEWYEPWFEHAGWHRWRDSPYRFKYYSKYDVLSLS